MISVSFIFLVIGSDASVSVLWFFHTRSFAVVIVGASFFFTSFENQRQNTHAHTHILVCSHWAIRNCGNSSIQSTAQSWGSAATTRPELLHPSCVASALPPARHLLYRKPTKSNRLYLCSSSARPVLRSIRPRHPTTTTAATFFINPLVTTPSVIVTIITVDACRWVLILTHFILHVWLSVHLVRCIHLPFLVFLRFFVFYVCPSLVYATDGVYNKLLPFER